MTCAEYAAWIILGVAVVLFAFMVVVYRVTR